MTSLPTTTTTHLPTTVRPESGTIRPPAVGARPAGGMGAGQIFSMLLRHIWLIVAVFLLVLLITAGLFVGSLAALKEYTAVGQMSLVEQVDPMTPGELRPRDRWTIERAAREQALRLSSEQNIIEFLKPPTRLAWLDRNTGKRKSTVELFLENLRADPIRDSGLVAVRFSDPDPQVAADTVNALMAFYRDRTRSESIDSSSEDRRVIQGELGKVESALTRNQTDLRSLRESKDYQGLERSRPEAIDRVAGLVKTEQEHLLAYEQARRFAEAAAGQDPNAPPSADVLSRVNLNPVLAQRDARLQSLIEERAQLEARGFLPNHPSIREINVRIAEVESARREKMVELVALERERTAVQAVSTAEALREQLEAIQKKLIAAQEDKRTLERLWTDARALEAEREQLLGQRERLQARLQVYDMRISQRAPAMTIFNSAPTPRPNDISFPRWEIFLAAGLVIGLGLAVGLVVLIELMDTSVRTPRDLSEQVRLPLLGFLPQVDDDLPREKLCRLVAADPMSMFAECFRQVRTNLLFAAPADQLHGIAITSAARDEGKTAVACNLAITVALSGRKVLLVDANFHRPALAAVFGLDQAVGLSNVLTNQATLADAAQATDVPNLSVMVTGPPPPNPAELMGSANMKQLLDQTDAEYDLVIFDAPPALLVTDALVLGSMVDGVVVVVRAVDTSRGTVGRLRDQLGRVNARIVGAVLNAARPTRGGYFRKSQQQYHEYLGNSAG